MAATSLEEFRAANAGLVTLATDQLDQMWASLDLTHPEASRTALIEFLTELTDVHGDVSATLAADWYDELRAEALVRGRFSPTLAPPVGAERVEASVRFGAQHLFTDHPEQTLAFLTGKLSKYVLQPGRDTITAATMRDPSAVGWKRVTRAGGCDFCRLLAGRGGVYKESTAHFASHGDCHCAAVPSWDQHAPEVDVKQYVASRRTAGMSPQQRAAHTARVRAYLA